MPIVTKNLLFHRHCVVTGSNYTLPPRSSASIILVTEGEGEQVELLAFASKQRYFEKSWLQESVTNKCKVSPGSVLFIPANATAKATCSKVTKNTKTYGKIYNYLPGFREGFGPLPSLCRCLVEPSFSIIGLLTVFKIPIFQENMIIL